MTRLLQDEVQTHDSKGLSRWLSSRLSARRDAREASRAIYEAGGGDAARDALLAKADRLAATPPEPPPTEDQLAAQDSMWGTLPEVKP